MLNLVPSVIRVLFTHHGANETHRNPNETLPPALPAPWSMTAPSG